MEFISGNGLIVTLTASNTYPVGIVISAFADDADPFDIPALQIADSAMGLNGDLIGWTKPNPIKMTLAVIPTSAEDIALGILLQANRAGRGKLSAQDVITLTGVYPNGQIIQLTEGLITDGMPGNSVASSSRLKSKTYNFSFENYNGI